MCSNYEVPEHLEELERLYKVRAENFRPRSKLVFPMGLAPFVRLKLDGSGERVLEEGHFGLLPVFAKEIAFGRKTYNARSETVHSKPSFRDSWRKGYRCVIPAEAVYEPCYETGKAVRWRIEQTGGGLLSVAGIYYPWADAEGVVRGTFAMLTVNAEGHSLYSRFHAPGEEKRMLILLDSADIDAWLSCTPEEARKFFRQWQGALTAFASPLPPRSKAA
jgi:putative SOS response-associated peptidase YedK